MSLSQSGSLMPLHSTVVSNHSENHCAPPLRFGATAPVKPPTRQGPCPGSRDEVRVKNQGGISRTAPPALAHRLLSLPPSYMTLPESCQAAVKVHGVFPSCCGLTVSSPLFQFTENVETAPGSLRHSCRSELTRQEFRYLRTVMLRPPFTGASIRASRKRGFLLTFRHRAGVTPYTSLRVCRVLCFC